MTAFLTGALLGLAGGAHCAAMCGALALTIGPRSVADGRWTLCGRLALYHGGRLGIYMLLAIPAGLAGEIASLGGLGRPLGVVAAVTMLAVAFGAGRRPSWQRVSAIAGQRAGRLMATAASWRQRFPRASLVAAGMANGLVPCGMVYAAALAAAGGGTLGAAAATMAGFGLGTLPVFAALVLAQASLPVRVRTGLRRVAPAALAIAAALLLLRAVGPLPVHHVDGAPTARHH